MAGRYLCTFAALVMATAHVKAFFLPPMVAPLVHPGLMGGFPFLGAPFFGKGFNAAAPQNKPHSKPFTLADLPGHGLGAFPVGNGFLPVIGNDGFMGGDVNLIGDNVNGIIGGNAGGIIGTNLGLAAASNDLNSLALAGAVEPLDAQNRLEISDSAVLLSNNNPGLGFAENPLTAGINPEISDSTFVVQGNGGVAGGLPVASVVTTF